MKRYEVVVPRIGRVRVNGYTPNMAAVQAQNIMAGPKACKWLAPKIVYRSCWVSEVYGQRKLKAERVRAFNGLGW